MKRVGLAVILVAAISNVTFAGPYGGFGLGTSPALNDNDVSRHQVAPDGSRSGKVLVGFRAGNISVEGDLGGFTLLQQNNARLGPFGNAYQASLSLKMNFPLGNAFEAFGHAGLQHMWMTDEADDTFSASGNGYVVGAGIEYRLKLGIGTGSIFIDYGLGNATLNGPQRTDTGISTRIWTLGVTLGI